MHEVITHLNSKKHHLLFTPEYPITRSVKKYNVKVGGFMDYVVEKASMCGRSAPVSLDSPIRSQCWKNRRDSHDRRSQAASLFQRWRGAVSGGDVFGSGVRFALLFVIACHSPFQCVEGNPSERVRQRIPFRWDKIHFLQSVQ